MASQVTSKKASRASEAQSKSKHPRKELENKEGEGGCRRVLCDILTLRVLVYVSKQPPSCTFIVVLFVIACCLPFIGLYISNKPMLPDLDAMQNWNAYLGKLGQNGDCFGVDSEPRPGENPSSIFTRYPPFNKSHEAYQRNWTMLSMRVPLDFSVDRTLVWDDEKKMAIDNVLVANLTGKEIGTQIKCDGKRIDEDGVFVYFWINTSTVNISLCDDQHCTVGGSVQMTAPGGAVPTRLPQVHRDFTFQRRVIHCNESAGNQSTRCPMRLKTLEELLVDQGRASSVHRVARLRDCSGSGTQLKLVNHHKFGAKVNGLIKIYLSETDRWTAAYHMYLAALAVAALGLTFTVGIILTDRPSEPKPSLE